MVVQQAGQSRAKWCAASESARTPDEREERAPTNMANPWKRLDSVSWRRAGVWVAWATALASCLGGDPPGGAGSTMAVVDTCSGIADGALCNDQNACTTGDTCLGGLCIGSPAVDDTPCTDGNQCTGGDACHAGLCRGNAVPEGSPCTDGEPCTEPDSCLLGLCVGGPARRCNDGLTCTLDVCVSGRGCVFTPMALCSDDGGQDALPDDGGVDAADDPAVGPVDGEIEAAVPEAGTPDGGTPDSSGPDGGIPPEDAAPDDGGKDAGAETTSPLDAVPPTDDAAGSDAAEPADASSDSTRGDDGAGGSPATNDASPPDVAPPDDGAIAGDREDDGGGIADGGVEDGNEDGNGDGNGDGNDDANQDGNDDGGSGGGTGAGGAAPSYEVRGGGCACGVAEAPRSATLAPWCVALALLFATRRRRRVQLDPFAVFARARAPSRNG